MSKSIEPTIAEKAALKREIRTLNRGQKKGLGTGILGGVPKSRRPARPRFVVKSRQV